jgi:hypothetical protein
MTERDLIAFRGDILTLVGEVCAIPLGGDDLLELRVAELRLKLSGIRAACDDLEAHVEQEADALALRDEPLQGRCPDMGWIRG